MIYIGWSHVQIIHNVRLIYSLTIFLDLVRYNIYLQA